MQIKFNKLNFTVDSRDLVCLKQLNKISMPYHLIQHLMGKHTNHEKEEKINQPKRRDPL